MEGIEIIDVWENENIQDEVIDFWRSVKAIPPDYDATDRAKQVAYIARKDGRLIGLTTALRRPAPLILNHPMFFFRILIHPDFRIPGLFDKLSIETKRLLEKLHTTGKTDCLGIISITENKGLIKHQRNAITPVMKMAFAGNTDDGRQIRVCYFPNVSI